MVNRKPSEISYVTPTDEGRFGAAAIGCGIG